MIIELGKLLNEVKTHTLTSEKGDRTVLNNRLMIYQGKNRTTFVDVTAWGGMAEFIEKHFKQGDEIFIEGELKNKTVTIEDKTFQSFFVLITNAVLRDSKNYSEQVRKWADNSVISMFIYETDNVLSKYIPDHLSEAAIEAIARDLIAKEKNKEMIKSSQGTEYEVVMHGDNRSLLAHTNPDNIILYGHYYITPEQMEKANITFSDKNIEDVSFSYQDAHEAYLNQIQSDMRTDKARAILLRQYNDFKDEMLTRSPEDIFESCYKISAVEDVYFHLTENLILTDAQEDYIIHSGENVLMDMAMDWYEYGNYTDELSDLINDCWLEKLPKIEADSEEEELE